VLVEQLKEVKKEFWQEIETADDAVIDLYNRTRAVRYLHEEEEHDRIAGIGKYSYPGSDSDASDSDSDASDSWC